MTHRFRTIVGAVSLVAAALVTGCNDSTVSPLTSGDSQEICGKDAKTRAGSWVKADDYEHSKKAAAIAAYQHVYAIQEGGNGLLVNYDGAGGFIPRAWFSEFEGDPVINMVAGPEHEAGIGSGGTGTVTHRGVYFLTESGKVYELFYSKGSWWVDLVPVYAAKDISVNNDGVLYLVYKHNDRAIYEYESGNLRLHCVSNESVKSISSRTDDNHENLVYLTENGKVYKVNETNSILVSGIMNTGSYTPVMDVEVEPNANSVSGYAFFSSYGTTTGSLHYWDPAVNSFVGLGSASKITIDKNGRLWDAYYSGIYSITLL